MDIRGWDARYRSQEYQTEEKDASPTPLLVEAAARLSPGRALDLACGAGRNALWLVKSGWQVTAVDGSSAAIGLLREQASAQWLPMIAQVADLQAGDYQITASSWDLIAICYYLQRDLFQPAKRGVAPGGLIVTIVHISEPGEPPKETRLERGQLAAYFEDWEILHYYEGKPQDPYHRRAVAEIIARRPAHK